MRVRYTPDVFRFQVAGGVSRYFVELTKGLRREGIDARIGAGLHINDLLDGVAGASGMNIRRLRPERLRQAVSKVVDHGLTAWDLARTGQSDIVHPTWYPPKLELLPHRGGRVVTVFDMIPERYPELSIRSAEATRRKRAWVGAADHVLVISDHTRRDLIELFDVEPERVTVTHLAADRPSCERTPMTAGNGPSFLLYVGDRRPPYKNVARMFESFAEADVPDDLILLCVGAPIASASESRELHRLGLESRVVFRAATDRELDGLYRRAVALVYPSLYEGFGLPPLEAMTRGCPVIASNAASIPEVVGDAALVVDPTDVEALARSMGGVLDPDVRRSLVEAGQRRAADFSWEATVEQTLTVYRDVVGVRA
jgi:glycosyltransferase involved in cell wall biosynthesis